MTKNIYFFQADDVSGAGDFATYWIPYSVLKVWSYALTQEDIVANWTGVDFFFEKRTMQEYLDKIEEPSICAFSSYIWNHKYHIAMAKTIKQKWPECIIVFGGPEIPEATHRLETFYNEFEFVDFTIHAEGEVAFSNLLRHLDGKVVDLMQPTMLPQGVTARGQYEMIKPDRIMDLTISPSPYHNGLAQSIIDKHPDKKWSMVIETTRGCPFNCTFCDWGSLTYAKTKKFEEDYVYKDLDFVGKNKISYVIFADANFGIFKGRDDDIIDYLVGIKETTGYPEIVALNWQKNSTTNTVNSVKKLVDADLDRGFTLSVQSMSKKVLENIDRQNMGINKFNEILDQCNVLGIPAYSEMIAGLPGETFDSWREGHFKLLEAGQHHYIDIYPAMVLVNAELNTDETREKYNIKTTKVKNPFKPEFVDVFDGIYEEGEYIVETNTLPYDDFINCFLFSWMITNFHGYGWTEVISRWLHKTQNIAYKKFYSDLWEFIKIDDFFGELFYDYKRNLEQKYSDNGFGGITFLPYKSTKIFFNNHKRTVEHVRMFLNDYGYDVSEDIIRYNKEYIIDFGEENEKEIAVEFPIWHIINDQDFDNNDLYHYKFINREPEKDSKEFDAKLYFNRRQGFGRFKIEPKINNK